MRVATYNVHDCVGRDGIFDPGRVIRVLGEIDADAVALQEVTLDHAGSLVDRFQQGTGLQAVDGSIFDRGAGRYGNLVLTRQAVASFRLHELPAAREKRGVIDVIVEVAGLRVRICATHLGLRRAERQMQLRQLSTLIAEAPAAALVLGDFNIRGQPPGLSAFTHAGFNHIPVRSFPTRLPLIALDRILVRSPLKLNSCWRHNSSLARIASDHYPIVADIQIDKLACSKRMDRQ